MSLLPWPMVEVTIGEPFKCTHEESWAFVEAGDIITYADGSSFYVDSFAIEEPNGAISMCIRCIVGPEHLEWNFGDPGVLGVNRRNRMPRGMMVAKGLT